MSLLDSFRKPAWQSKDAGRRAEAVASDSDPELIAALPGIAGEDADAGVRRSALRRLDAPAMWAKAMLADPDPVLREQAREAWLAAVAGGRCPIDAAAWDALLPAELERLAARGVPAEVRGAALALCRRPAFLAERALLEPEAGLRLALVDRLDSAELLDRLADKARRTDKQVARAARERAQQLRLASGDPGALGARAEALCVELEAQLRGGSPAQERARALAHAEEEWAGLAPDRLPAQLAARFHGLCQALRLQLAPPPPSAPEQAPPDDATRGADDRPAPATASAPPPPSPEELAAQARLQAELAMLAEERERERVRQQERESQRQELRRQQGQRLDALAAALAAGDLGRAREVEAQLDPALFDADLRRRRQALEPELRKLRDWEHWANNKVRARLCDELEALAGSGLHPDALATRVREVQAEWKRLDALEGRAEGAEATGLDRRFRAICARVLKPARGFFEKRDALRKERERAIAGFVAEALRKIEDGADTATLMQLQADASARLRALSDLPAGLRQRLAGRLTGLLDAIRPQVEAAFSEVEQARTRLVEAARRLVGADAGVNRGAEARRLMQSWKTLGKGRPGRDQKQWREFRAALDEAFAELETARSRVQSERESLRQQALALVEEAESLAGSGDEALPQAPPRMRDLRIQWQALDFRDSDLERRFEQAVGSLRQAVQAIERSRQRQRLLARLDERPGATPPGDATSALALVFEIEALAGIEPPASDREARRQWQLERLQRHMRGDRGESGNDPESLLERWLSQAAGLDPEQRRPMEQRLRAAILALY